MVTKLMLAFTISFVCSVLAKIHMVTKLNPPRLFFKRSSVLAKIHMVTKPQKHAITFLN